MKEYKKKIDLANDFSLMNATAQHLSTICIFLLECHISIDSLLNLLKTDGTILNDVYFTILDILSSNNVSISDSTYLQSMNFLFANVFSPIPIIFSEFSLTREDFDFLSQFKF